MSSRKPEDIRAEIEAERERLASAIDTLGTDAKRTGRRASVVLGAAAGLMTLRKVGRAFRKK